MSWSVDTMTSTPSAAKALTRSRSGAEASRLRPECTWKSAEMAFVGAITRFSWTSAVAMPPLVT